ncbi:hypothetical protein PHET_09167 [Paragonimus heterotremus]|uniref:Uncharacterized protein n=1 Tax=Paragonimus heterotremus TaxID=100268 RepID=A0A8J4WP06_9TREM|nr:hypothetical protein PHET_09167 [Paragonimus heterotremus]
MSLFDDLPEPSARSDPVDSKQQENNLEPPKNELFERPCRRVRGRKCKMRTFALMICPLIFVLLRWLKCADYLILRCLMDMVDLGLRLLLPSVFI